MEKLVLEKTAFSLPVAGAYGQTITLAEAKAEAVRKSLHFLIALSPGMAAISLPFAVASLFAGVLAYTAMELLRCSGVKVPFVSAITRMASRERDMGRFVSGPVTLGIGAMLALLLFPLPVAGAGIFALAFGDGFASLAGRLFGRIRPAFLLGKSVEGSAACFVATGLSVYLVSQNYMAALTAAFVATAVEALPLEDYDNIVLPLAVGAAVQWIL
ncbi:MAG: SEC59/DGK1/VTE5 family protein [Treponema sp.]|nr:SEC59/DGK1/VTE5 family protein [Treponema sp.]